MKWLAGIAVLGLAAGFGLVVGCALFLNALLDGFGEDFGEALSDTLATAASQYCWDTPTPTPAPTETPPLCTPWPPPSETPPLH